MKAYTILYYFGTFTVAYHVKRVFASSIDEALRTFRSEYKFSDPIIVKIAEA